MKLRPTITISLCLNLPLAGAAVQLLKRPASHTPQDSAATISETTTPPAWSSAPAVSNAPAPVTFVTNHFRWRAVETEDYEQLAMNLRAIGCPEKTIRDVVVARARRGLDRLSWRVSPQCPFWAAGLQRARAQLAADHARGLAWANLLARVERALGGDAFIEDGKLMEDFMEQAIVRFMSGPFPIESSKHEGHTPRQATHRSLGESRVCVASKPKRTKGIAECIDWRGILSRNCAQCRYG